MILSKKMRFIIILIYAGLTLLAVFAAFKANDMSSLNDSNSYTIPVELFSNDFTAHRLVDEDVGIQTYEVSIDKSELEHLKTDSLKMFINKLTDNAYIVYINNEIVAHEGDMNRGRSMLKNSPNIITFDKAILNDLNTITIETYATYKSGLETKTVYIADSISGMKLEKSLLFYGTRLILLGIGFIIFAAALMIFIYYVGMNKERAFVYCALATLLIGIYFIDYIKIISIPVNYFTYKKVFMICLYLGAGFYTLAIGKFLKNSKLNYLTWATVISFIIMTMFAPTMIVYKELYEYWYLLLLLNIVLWFGFSLIKYRVNEHAFIFVIGFLYLTVYSSFAILVEFFGGTFNINSPLVYIVILATLPLLLGFEEIMFKEKQISIEQEQRENEFLNSITDELTGAWNQRYLYMKMRENPSGVTLAMIDLDDFKYVNDKYGHLAGDYVLKEISRFILKSIRKTDDFCRYGGDEFVAMLYGCADEEAYITMEKVRKLIQEHKFVYNNQIIDVTVSIGLYGTEEDETLEESLEKADKELYQSKQHGKNFVSIKSNN